MAVKKKEVTIYSTPQCHFCTLAKRYFKDNKITFKEISVDTDIEARERMATLSGGYSVPVITVGDEVMVGFGKTTKDKIKEIFDIKEGV